MSTLYPYQAEVLRLITAGKNVIIQAPTGAGKTRAALYPYFAMLDAYNGQPDAPLPLTCRYAVPMRVLATQFEREFHDYFDKLDRTHGTDFVRRYREKLKLNLPALQTGEAPDDAQFESPLTFCTIDQLLASFIGTPYSLGKRGANMNVGAVVGSYLILDEFHLYPLQKAGNGARMTTLAMLQLLAGFSPFVLMTATFSTKLLASLGTLLNAEVVRVTDAAEVADIMRGRSRTICRATTYLSPEGILATHAQASARNAGASLVVCNTVARAQAIYQQLCDTLIERGITDQFNVQLLHSRFTSEDRQEKSANLERWLGADRWQEGRFVPIDGKEVIVVGTQVVEVGLNISAGVLHTELAPANSLIQRAGRCARFPQQQGTVIVYPIPPREGSDKVSHQPYDEEPCAATWAYLGEQCPADGSPLMFGFAAEQDLIDHVHTAADEQMIATFSKADIQLRKTIMEVLTCHDRGKLSDLIRDVAQVSVVIHANPEDAITVNPFNWQAFGLNPGTLAGAWKALDDRRVALGLNAPAWVMKELQSGGETGSDALGADGDNDRQPVYTWVPLSLSEKTAYSLIRATLRIALPPQLAAYDKEIGFRLLLTPEAAAGGWQSQERALAKKKPDMSGRQGSYVEHISGLMGAYRFSVCAELAWIAKRLERAMSLPAGSMDHAVRLAIACHDIGKLSQGWQRWAQDWQNLLVEKKHDHGYKVTPERTWLAKTDRLPSWEWRTEKEWQKALPSKRPHHACESAIASEIFLTAALMGDPDTMSEMESASTEALSHATISAIARHHAPLAHTHEAVAWDASAIVAIHQALKACDLPIDAATHYIDLTARPKGEIAPEHLISPTSATAHATWLSFLIVRALRLCDQRAESGL